MTNTYQTDDMILNDKLLELTDEQYNLYGQIQKLKSVLGNIPVRDVQRLMIEDHEIMEDFHNIVEQYDREFTDVPVDNQLRVEIDSFLRDYLGFGLEHEEECESKSDDEESIKEESDSTLSLSKLHIEK